MNEQGNPNGAQSGQVCDRCRRRKIRCYGDGEKCTPCTAGGVACVVSTKLKRNRKRKSYYENEVIDERRSGSTPTRTPDSIGAMIESHSNLPDATQLQSAVTGRSSSTTSVNIASRSGSTWPHRTEATSTRQTRHGPEPVIGHMGRLVSNDDQIAMFAGSSTGVHFISQAEQQLQMLRIHSDTFPSSVYSLYLHNLWSTPSQDSESQIIAAIVAQFPLDAIDILEKTVDRWTPLYPIVHKQSTIDAFQKLYDDPEHGDLSILYQVLGLLALGTLGHAGGCDQNHRHFLCVSDKYYTMSANLTSRLSERPGLPTLQGLEIAQIYLQLSSRHSVASHLGGMATRMAQNLGLHRHSLRFKFDPLETELRRRVWWCQYSLDTFSSAYHGMPRLIRDQDVDTDLPSRVDHDQVSRDCVAFPLPGERSQVDSALCMFKLAVIVGEALEKLYTTTRRRGGVAKITQLQAELTMWERMLPIDKAGDADDEAAEPPAVSVDAFEVAFLRAAFCNATVHVHRPALAFTTADPQFTISLMACGRASAELIRLSANVLGDTTTDTTHRQFDAMIIAHLQPNGTHMLWQAGLTILFARWKGQPITTDEGDEDLVRTCAETLRQFREENATKGDINQCAEVLDMLRAKTFSSKETQPPGMDQLQWNVWDWPMASALELANTLDAMPLDLQFGPELDL